MDPIIGWIEAHKVTVNLLQWAALIAVAWFSGIFRFFKKYSHRARLKVISTASFVYIDEHAKDKVRSAFIVDASITNRSSQKIVISSFELCYRCSHILRSFRQRIVRIPFPTRPQTKIGSTIKYMPVFFTDFSAEPEDLKDTLKVDLKLEPFDQSSGYLLFISSTWGSWSPLIREDRLTIVLKVLLTNGDTLKHKIDIPVVRTKESVESFSPGLINHMLDETTWHHDLSILK